MKIDFKPVFKPKNRFEKFSENGGQYSSLTVGTGVCFHHLLKLND